MFEVGKSYRYVMSGRVFLCLCVDKDTGWMKHDNDTPGSNTWSNNWQEVKPKITKKYWLSHGINGKAIMWDSDPRNSTHKIVQYDGTWYPRTGTVVAITEHSVTFEEGEGLS